MGTSSRAVKVSEAPRMFTWPLIGVKGDSLVGSFSVKVREPMIMPTSDMEKVESLPPADLHFQVSA